MKKKTRRLRLNRETLRELTSDQLQQADGGNPCSPIQDITLHNSCDLAITRPCSLCLSCINIESICC
ncbi:MAG: class I lanthipeptide [Acidobacteriota bacterium]